MLTNQPAKTDPIFVAIEAHRRATAARCPILERMVATNDDAPEYGSIEDAHDKAAQAEIEAETALTNVLATTVPGLMALTVYVSKLVNHGHEWIGGDLIDEDAGDTEPRSFEACLIRCCAAALAKINGVTAISARS